jgi:REP element-mobilizing transposase RayT
MGRGIERKEIFYSDTDRSDFIDRLAVLVDEGALNVYAWVLMPNHFHLLVKIVIAAEIMNNMSGKAQHRDDVRS